MNFLQSLGLMGRTIKFLSTELAGQYMNVLSLPFFSLNPLQSINTEKAAGNKFLYRPYKMFRVNVKCRILSLWTEPRIIIEHNAEELAA